jgi:hypothetical protein
MRSKYLSILVIFFITLIFSGCLNSLIFEPNKNQGSSFENQLDSFKKGFSAQTEKKEYETNRIFSNDFPITYRAKAKKTF